MTTMPMNTGVTAFQIPGYTPEALGMATPALGNWVLGENQNNPLLQGQVGGNGLNLTQSIGLGLQGLNTIGGLIMGLKQLSLANKQFNFQKQFAETNLANSVKSYNTQLGDRLRARSVMETGSTAGSEQAIAANSLRTKY